jgi:phospholipase C
MADCVEKHFVEDGKLLPHDPPDGKYWLDEQWPDVVAQPVPKFDVTLLPPNRTLSVLGKGILRAVLEFEKPLGAHVPTIPPDATLTGAQAVNIMRDNAFQLFPGLRTKT